MRRWGNYIALPEEPNPMIKREYVKKILDSFPEELDIDWDTLRVIEHKPEKLNPMIKREYVKKILDSVPEEIDIDWDTLRDIEQNDEPDHWTIGIKFETK